MAPRERLGGYRESTWSGSLSPGPCCLLLSVSFNVYRMSMNAAMMSTATSDHGKPTIVTRTIPAIRQSILEADISRNSFRVYYSLVKYGCPIAPFILTHDNYFHWHGLPYCDICLLRKAKATWKYQIRHRGICHGIRRPWQRQEG